MSSTIKGRQDFANVKRILVKVGTTVVTQSDGSFALGRLGNIVEEISELLRSGKEVLMVSSGSVGKGTQKLYQQFLLSTPLQTFYGSVPNQANFGNTKLPARACAAAGQSGMMNLYEDLFSQKGVSISQVLLTENDFREEETRQNLRDTLDSLLKWRILPIINENDVVSTRTVPIRDENNCIFWDNDSLAALIAREARVDLLILLSDVDGIYTRSPDDPDAKIISVYMPNHEIVFGQKSRLGRGGMQAKVDAALSAVRSGVPAVVIASGYQPHTITNLIQGKRVGTLFLPNPPTVLDEPTLLASEAKHGGLQLRSLKGSERSQILLEYANLLEQNTSSILEANKRDLNEATRNETPGPLMARLKLTEDKLKTLITGIRQIASSEDPIGRVLARTELSEGLILEKQATSIGVLLVIFESRPDALPQLVSLAIRTGNAILLKGGREAQHTNAILHKLAQDAISRVNEISSVKVSRGVIGLVHNREDIASLLKLDKEIDLVIPRGSSSLVQFINNNTRIPVMGHTEGICHIYVHRDANIEKAIRIILDAKLDYPAACNSVETLLIDAPLLSDGSAMKILEALYNANVELFGTKELINKLPNSPYVPVKLLTTSFHHEYSDAKITVQLVDGVDEAIDHINSHGSGHTDAIVCEDNEVAEVFKRNTDSACVFHNASTRFADGYRFGLGAEVGISTSRIHARGPVGAEGLLTMKWILSSTSKNGHTAGEFTKGENQYTHKVLPLQAKL